MENWKQTKGLRGADPSSTVTGEREASPSQKVVVRANGEMMHMASSSKVVSDAGYGAGVEMRRKSGRGCAFPVVFFRRQDGRWDSSKFSAYHLPAHLISPQSLQ